MTRAEVPKKGPKVVGLLVGTNNLRAGQSSMKIASLMDYLLGWMQVGWGVRLCGWAAPAAVCNGQACAVRTVFGLSPALLGARGHRSSPPPRPQPAASTCPAVHPTLAGRLSTLEDTGAQPAAPHLARCQRSQHEAQGPVQQAGHLLVHLRLRYQPTGPQAAVRWHPSRTERG